MQVDEGAEKGQGEVGARQGGLPPLHVMAGHLQGQLPRLEEPPGHQGGHLGEEVDQRQVGEQDDGLLVVASPDGGVLDLPEVGEAEEEVGVELEGGQGPGRGLDHLAHLT